MATTAVTSAAKYDQFLRELSEKRIMLRTAVITDVREQIKDVPRCCELVVNAKSVVTNSVDPELIAETKELLRKEIAANFPAGDDPIKDASIAALYQATVCLLRALSEKQTEVVYKVLTQLVEDLRSILPEQGENYW